MGPRVLSVVIPAPPAPPVPSVVKEPASVAHRPTPPHRKALPARPVTLSRSEISSRGPIGGMWPPGAKPRLLLSSLSRRQNASAISTPQRCLMGSRQPCRACPFTAITPTRSVESETSSEPAFGTRGMPPERSYPTAESGSCLMQQKWRECVASYELGEPFELRARAPQ